VPIDGRVARRDRNKVAVTDAYLDFIREGISHPSVAEVAQRSGVSHRSVFRYFADRDEMARTSIERQQARLAPIINRVVDPDQPLADRIDQVIRHRSDLFEAVAATARLTRTLAPAQPILQAELTTTRVRLRTNLKRVFARELEAMPAESAADVLATLDVLTSFESYELMRHDQALSKPRTARALRRTMTLLLATDSAPR